MRFLILLMAALVSCATPPPPIYPVSELKQQIMMFRQGYKSLINQRCVGFSETTKECVKWDVREYNLEDDATRKMLISLNWFCSVGSKRYLLCDETGKQLCRRHEESHKAPPFGLGTKHEWVVDRLDINADTMAQMGVMCGSSLTYPYGFDVK